MELAKYPVLEDHISATEVVTPQGRDLLIYDTTTRMKKQANAAVFDFLRLATGETTFQQIVEELSQTSGESFDEIWPGLSGLADKMVKSGLLKVLDAPAEQVRCVPPPVELVYRLENVSFEITRQCNLRCKHCYADAGVKLPDELTTEEIFQVIDELYNTGVLSITFTGGEPLMHPHIFELMEYAHKKPLTVVLFTNGTLLTEDVVQKLKELTVYRVNVSIDGPDAGTHDTFRGVQGAFEKTMQGVTLLQRAGINIHASTSLTRQNYKRVKEMLSLLEEVGVTDSKLWPPTFSGRSEEELDFLTPEEFREAMVAMHEVEQEKREFKYCRTPENCGVGWGALVIKCNGVVTPCPSFGETFSLGSIREQPIRDIWNDSLLLNKLRAISVFKTEPCKDCEFAAFCKGGCIADVYMRTGEFSCYDPYMCIAFDVTRNDFVPVLVEDTQSADCALHFQNVK